MPCHITTNRTHFTKFLLLGSDFGGSTERDGLTRQLCLLDAEISDNMDKATGHLNEVNHKLKETLQKAGGATSIIVKVILLILLLAVGAYLYKMFA
jgi:hypothetical protein